MSHFQPTRLPLARRAFTLIELLVVVAIIAVLIAILLPSLGRAREKAKTAGCLANLKSISLAYVMYCNDVNNGHTSVQDTKMAGTIWMFQVQNYLGGNNVRGLTHGSQVSGNVFFCPDASTSNPAGNIINGGGTSGFWGNVNNAWDGGLDGGGWWDKAINSAGSTSPSAIVAGNNPTGLTDVNNNPINTALTSAGGSPGYRSSYGINSWMDIRYPYGNRGTQGVGMASTGAFTPSTASSKMPPNYIDMRVLSNIGQQATTPLVADMIWVNTDQKTNSSTCFGVVPSDYGPTSASAPAPNDLTGDNQSALGRVFINRHDKAVNVGFLGGNASTVKLTDLTQLDWYNGATRTTLASTWTAVVNR